MIYQQKLKTIKTASKTKTNMKNYLRGLFFCSMWYLSIIAGFFLLVCPILPLAIISPKKYRRWSDLIFGMWEPFPVAMMEVCFGIRVILSGDKIDPFEGSLFVMNHRTRVDWNFLWLGLFHCCQPNAHNMKYILKSSIMHLPGLGWVMQTCSFIFLHRKWDRDKPLLDNIIEYLNQSDSLYQILLFPEGTDLTESNIQKSHKYAEENNLEKYYKVLHPRTTGFAFIAQKMNSGGQLKAIYDLTIAYPKTLPQTETDLLRGKFPEEVHFNVKRYSSTTLPQEEDSLKDWLNKVWKEKEAKLHRFYETGSFISSGDDSQMLFNLAEEDIDLRKMSIKNGVITYEGVPDSPLKELSVFNVDRRILSGNSAEKNSSSDPVQEEPVAKEISAAGISQEKAVSASPTSQAKTRSRSKDFTTKESEPVESQKNWQSAYKSKNYRPSHLLYLVLIFWLTLIVITIHLLFYNLYIQIWVMVHSLLFIMLSFVSNGFHHVAAAMYLYRYDQKCEDKKNE